ncbi:GTP-binding protein [Streptomyces sp. MNU89]|uniref:CobW family GTP-binding protein n=1 Tax=Streptomyces sp. MNU89 TaxID=2560025 RepID=UPI001E3C0D17|nr:GTP-binding protein [Streptomyces sp. MNU89]MCC9742580.1 GTP-binding protein [Streptomyces sp. MNU89]
MTGAHGPRLPVAVVAGLHSDARRRTVETLLRVPGTVALHHDLAEAADGTVLRTVRDADGVLETGSTPLVNDCACCALREDLVPALNLLAESGEHRLAVVELWDSVEPQGMAEVLAGHAGEVFALTAVVTAVDPALVLPYAACGDDLAEAGLAAAPGDRRTVADAFARQLEYPSLLAVSEGEEKPDAADAELLRQLAPAACRIPLGTGELGRAVLAGFDAGAAAARQHPACALLPQEADGHGVSTLVWQRRRPFHPGRLHAALEDLTCAALRSRGRFWLADRPDTLLSWDAAGGALCVEESGPWLAALPDAAWELVPAGRRVAAALDWHPVHGDRAQCLSFVSLELDREGLLSLLESCLLTDAEYAAGPEGWRSLHPAFDDLLRPVR